MTKNELILTIETTKNMVMELNTNKRIIVNKLLNEKLSQKGVNKHYIKPYMSKEIINIYCLAYVNAYYKVKLNL